LPKRREIIDAFDAFHLCLTYTSTEDTVLEHETDKTTKLGSGEWR